MGTEAAQLGDALNTMLEHIEKWLLLEALQKHGNNKSATAKGQPGQSNTVWCAIALAIAEDRETQANLFIEDAIEETQVLTSGISAEYGRFSGGVPRCPQVMRYLPDLSNFTTRVFW